MADFIITSLQSWDIEIGSTIKNTALEISKKHRVFYVCTPPTLMSWLRQSRKMRTLPDKKVNDNLYVVYCKTPALPVASLPFRWMFRSINYLNNVCIAHTIKQTMQRYHITDFIQLVDNDLFRSRYLKQLLHPSLFIYYRRDYVIGMDYWKKYGAACEHELVGQADLVMTNSTYFTEELKPFNTNIHTTNTGVNLELYDARIQHPIPAELAAIPCPVIGYTGAVIELRLDSALLYNVARQLPEYNFVFVGPEDEHFKAHALHQLKNVYFTGHKEVHQLPQYIQHFDVCINPQILNPITEGNYPLKIDEYLALGRPVVATSTHTMRDVFGAHTHLAHDTATWVEALRTAAGETRDAQLSAARIAFAHTHSWGHSVEKIYKAIGENLVIEFDHH